MKKYILDLKLVDNTELNNQYVLLKLTHENILPPILPGQFAEVRVDGSPKTFLRRPISISFVDRSRNEIWLLIQKVGEGTETLARAQKGDIINCILPLGNTFTPAESKRDKIALIGGGVGVAPLLMYGEWLYKNAYQVCFMIGARSKGDLLLLNEFEKYGELFTTTEDGTAGEMGFITQHSRLKQPDFAAIYTCGPTPMMKAVALYAENNNIFCEASLENLMACGIGACLCCVTDTKDKGNLCVCTEGPIFNVTKLKW